MRLYLLVLIFFFSFLSISAQKTNKNLAWPDVTIESKPFTRWWWLGSAVDKPGITWNLEELSKAGIGGVEITPIYGVKGMEKKNIPYLSNDWMSMLSHTISESKRLGMNIDMATGTGWPFGGPDITIGNAASRLILQTYDTKEGNYFNENIRPKEKNQENATLEVVMAFSSKGEKKNLTTMVNPEGKLSWMPGEGTWKIIALYNGKTMQKVKRPAPGGEGLVMDHFSKTAFNSYAEKFNIAFTESKCAYPKTFFNDSYEVYNADWSPVFLEEFKKRRGYNFEDYLNLFAGIGNAGEVALIKSDYRETLSDILLENFTKNWTSWAHSKNAATRNQAHGSPGNLIDIYAAVDIPECESFGTTSYEIPGLRRDTGYIRPGDADPMMLKFASSAAHISGKKYVSSETFTWLGEHFRVSLSQCKPQLDDIFTSGINHVYFHGTPYSPKDAAWPGWRFYASVNFSPTNRFWRDIPAMTSYIARCQSFLQMGQPDNDFLLYFPIHDLWYSEKGTDMPFTIHGIDSWLHNTAFYNTGKAIMGMGYDLDYISDRFVKMATVRKGLIQMGGNNYKALVIPACRFMPLETLKALLELARKGANVVFVDLPSEVPGLSNLEKNRLELQNILRSLSNIPLESKDKMASFGKGKLAIGSTVEQMLGFLNISKEGAFEHTVKYIRRKNPEGYHYFFANLHSKPLNDWIQLAVNAKSAVIFDPLTGKTGVALLRKEGKKTLVYLQLNPGESLILKTYTKKRTKGEKWMYIEKTGNPLNLKGPWNLSFADGEPTISQSFVLDKLHSWTELPDSNLIKFSGTGKYSLTFMLPEIKTMDWVLNLGEVHESASVRINGNNIGTLWSVPFTARVGKYLKPGSNTIEVEVTNIDANRIADYDRRGVPWKIFNDINIVNVNYKPFDASAWAPVASGLVGPVSLTPILEK